MLKCLKHTRLNPANLCFFDWLQNYWHPRQFYKSLGRINTEVFSVAFNKKLENVLNSNTDLEMLICICRSLLHSYITACGLSISFKSRDWDEHRYYVPGTLVDSDSLLDRLFYSQTATSWKTWQSGLVKRNPSRPKVYAIYSTSVRSK